MKRLVRVVALMSVIGSAGARSEETGPWTGLTEVPSPAGVGSGQPSLWSGGDGAALLSWLEPTEGGGHRLRLASKTPEGWSEPRTVAEGKGLVVNWADVPAVVRLADGRLAAQWLEFTNVEKFAYDVRVATSADGGKSWSRPVTPHRDGMQAEHGFVSLFDAASGGLGIAWLDGRASAGAEGHAGHSGGATALMTTVLGADGQLGAETQLDERVCDCCPTAVTWTDKGLVLAYRDRSGDEIRDISVARLEAGAWTKGAVAHADGWKIDGCPVNGPALSSSSKTLVLAWTTGAGDRPRVLAAFSKDGGATFGPAIPVDGGQPIGRVDVELLPDGAALVLWVERTAGGAEVRARRVRPEGAASRSSVVAAVSEGRVSGYPRLARVGNQILFAWTSTGDKQQVKTALAPL